MKYLALLATTVGVYGQSYGSFNSTSYDIGDFRVTTGSYTAPKPSVRDEIIASYQRMNESLSRDIAESRRAFYQQMEIDELKRQTRILEQIANKK